MLSVLDTVILLFFNTSLSKRKLPPLQTTDSPSGDNKRLRGSSVLLYARCAQTTQARWAKTTKTVCCVSPQIQTSIGESSQAHATHAAVHTCGDDAQTLESSLKVNPRRPLRTLYVTCVFYRHNHMIKRMSERVVYGF